MPITGKRQIVGFFPFRQPRMKMSAVAAAALLLTGCSIKNFAIKEIGSALSEGTGSAFAEEADVEFAGQAIPFSLKLVESLLHEQPNNAELLLAAASGFTQYSKVWVEQPADFIEDEDFSEAQRQRERARAFYLRAYDYGMRGLNVQHTGFSTRFRSDPKATAAELEESDIDLAYWTAASLGSAISLSRTDPEMIARLAAVEALVDRAFEIEPDWNDGALHEMMMSLELSRTSSDGNSHARVLEHFQRAVELTHERSAGPYVSLAESISVQEQNREQFVSLLNKALAIDPDAHPENRLANVVAQKRARWLLSRVDDLFLE
jgi:predicted anti-sigma-YlaC factor YlaD